MNIQLNLACAVDNAANMIRIVELLIEQQSVNEDENETNEEMEAKEEKPILAIRCITCDAQSTRFS